MKAFDFLLAEIFLAGIGEVFGGGIKLLKRFFGTLEIAAVEQAEHEVDLFGEFIIFVLGEEFFVRTGGIGPFAFGHELVGDVELKLDVPVFDLEDINQLLPRLQT